jgi:hypothetical protein
MLVEIRGHNLPGTFWHTGCVHYDNVHVGIQIRREPCELVPADADTASWTIDVDTIADDRGVDFRGAVVQGRRGDRFVYLTWGNIGGDGSFSMFRRAKFMLADLQPFITATGGDQRIIAIVDLTDNCGGPRCARLRPPALELRSGNYLRD